MAGLTVIVLLCYILQTAREDLFVVITAPIVCMFLKLMVLCHSPTYMDTMPQMGMQVAMVSKSFIKQKWDVSHHIDHVHNYCHQFHMHTQKAHELQLLSLVIVSFNM